MEKERIRRRMKREARLAIISKQRRTAKWLVIITGAVRFCATFLVGAFTGVLEPAQKYTPSAAVVAAAKPKASVKPKPASAPANPVFRYSIVPGGVRSADGRGKPIEPH